MMRPSILAALATAISVAATTIACADPWKMVEAPVLGTILSQSIPGNSGGREYEFVTAMCKGKSLVFAFTVARKSPKPDVYINEGGFGETRLPGKFQTLNDGGPALIYLTEAASRRLYRELIKIEREGRKAGSPDASIILGPGFPAGGDPVEATDFTKLAPTALRACVK